MLDFDAARARILEDARRRSLARERVPLPVALGRVLARDVLAEEAVPARDHSAMDGYAVRAIDVGADGAALRVAFESRAGVPGGRLEPGTAARIFTGALLPDGADAVVIQENVERVGDEVRFAGPVKPYDNVRRRGEDLEIGALALPAGQRLGAARLGLLASLDHVEVEVFRRPRVHVLCTGDELRAPGSTARSGSIPESNSLGIVALAAQAGADSVVLPFASDDPGALRAALAEGARGADVLVTIGGVSVGDHDLVRPTLEGLGAVTSFWKVAMKPGKPLLFGALGETFVLGLPGNPASALVTFLLFGLPLLRVLSGESNPVPERRRARLREAVRQKPGRRNFIRAELLGDEVRPLSNQASGATTAMAWANALLVIPEEVSELEAGAHVEVIAFAEC